MFNRRLKLVLPEGQSAFLWGARQTGKSTYLSQRFPKALIYDFLKSDLYLRFLKEPFRLREELLENPPPRGQPIILDEVQRVPLILDEVHWMIENKKFSFILCGSSARKLKRGQANLLGGRAWRFEMFPLVFPEIPDFDLLKALTHGLLPPHYRSLSPQKSLKSYVNDYLTEEIKAEGLSRNLAAFARFLEAAAFSHGELVEYKNIASDCGVDAKTVKEYFEILKDTYLGTLLMPLAKRDRKAILATPKFYFFDPGVANFLTRSVLSQLKGAAAGKSFEGYILHELQAYSAYAEKDFSLNYWRTKAGHEVDFVLNRDEVYIEVKISDNVKSSDLRGLRTLLQQTPSKKALVVCLEKRPRLVTTPEGPIHLVPWRDFLERLWGGEII